MAITVKPDTVYGSSAKLGPNGPEATRSFLVTTTAQENQFEILSATGIPELYDEYPYDESPIPYPLIFAQSIDCQPVDEENGVYRVLVYYSRPDPYAKAPGTLVTDSVMQVGASLTAGRTANDKNGARITVSLTNQPDQVGEVEIQTPEVVLLFERREAANPVSKAISYAGKVNSDSLQAGTYAARTLLCLGIEGVSSDDGETWLVSYRFQYRPQTWAATVLYIDPETDRPHEDIDLSVSPADGAKSVNIYSEAVFDDLNLF